MPRITRGGLDQLFKSKPPEPPRPAPRAGAHGAEGQASAPVDHEIEETKRRAQAATPTAGLRSSHPPEPLRDEPDLYATIVQGEDISLAEAETIDRLLAGDDAPTADAHVAFPPIPSPYDDEPTQHLSRKALHPAAAPSAPPAHAAMPTPAVGFESMLARRSSHWPAEPPAEPSAPDLVTALDTTTVTKLEQTLSYGRSSDDDAPTRLRPRSDFPSLRPPSGPEREPPPAREFDGEQPARDVIDADNKAALVERAEWFENEARAMSDRLLGARTLLAASELHAMCGNVEAAARLADEVRDIDPRLLLAHWQARALMPRDGDRDALVNALDAESRHALSPSHRLHAALVAAEHLRAAGDDAGAARRWDHAASIAPEDARAATARAVRALARADYSHPGLRVDASPALAPISLGIGTALRLRGVERPEGDCEILANDSLRRARIALERGDTATAAMLISELRSVPELARGAAWLAAALGATRSETQSIAGQWVRRLVGGSGAEEAIARRQLAALGIETGDAALVDHAMTGDDTFGPQERATLAALMRLPLPQSDAELAAIAMVDGMEPLAAAIAGITLPSSPSAARARAERTAGREATRKLVTLGRLLGTGALDEDIRAALSEVQGDGALSAIALELATRAGRYDDVSRALGAWFDRAEAASTRDHQLAAALVAERAGHRALAITAYKAARSADAACGPAVRALLDLDDGADSSIFLAELADAVSDPLRSALLRLEAIARAPELDDSDVAGALEDLHKAAPYLPFAPFLAERVARKNGNIDEVLRWIRERRSRATDPIENALDAVREALLVADTEPEIAAARIAEAHRARPDDVALRELYERLATSPLDDRGAWREARAASAVGASKASLLLEAALEFERAGDKAAFLRAAQATVAAGDAALGRLALERAEVEGGAAARLADELIAVARSAEDPLARREAYERLADLDAIGRGDPASALLWHRAILEEDPSHKPSLAYVEHAYVSGGRDEDLEPITSAIARALSGTSDGEAAAHAELAVRLRVRGEGGWDATRDMVELAASQPEPPLWALRQANAHARATRDDGAVLTSTLALTAKTTRSMELASLHLRAAEAALRVGDEAHAREQLETASREDPGDVVTWRLLGDMRQSAGDARGAAEAAEALARLSGVMRHQLLAWYDAAGIWLDDANDVERALPCLEQAAAIDVTHEDVFARLSALYSRRGAHEELAALLAKRIANVATPAERVELEVQRGRALADLGDEEGARAALKAALADQPDHVLALAAYGDLCAAAADWEGAEQAWVRLSRSLNADDEQREVYKKLGELYSVHAVNLPRAEVAFREVLKRAPEDAPTLERLVNVYARQNDAPRALEVQQQLLAAATDPAARRARVIELARLYDEVAHEARKAEQTLEGARREAPGDVSLLRALAEFYARHKQGPAVNILLDRASGDARRALAAGRFTAAAFEMLQTVYELRSNKDAARVVGATLAAFEGRPSAMRGGDARAGDPRLDDLLAPELLTGAMRALLARAGDALDAAAPLDLRALQAIELPSSASALHHATNQLSHTMGIGPVQILVSRQLGRTCVPCTSSPAVIVLGEPLLSAQNEAARAFLILRALKLVQARASALVRMPGPDMAVLVAAWLTLFNPQWRPEGMNPAALAEAGRRVYAGLPRQMPPDVGVIALEVAGSIGTQGAALGAAAISWANRMALLAAGDLNVAFEAIAWSMGMTSGAPVDREERVAWATRTLEVKDLVSFSVTDAYAEARARLGLDNA